MYTHTPAACTAWLLLPNETVTPLKLWQKDMREQELTCMDIFFV